MTLDQFRSLHADQQRQVVQYKGVFLLSRSAVGLTAKLYQVDASTWSYSLMNGRQPSAG